MPTTQICVAVVIERGNKILLVQEKRNKVIFVCGIDKENL